MRMNGRTGDLLGVNMVFQCVDAVYLGGLQCFLLFPCIIDPVQEGGAGLLVMLQLRLIQFQILKSMQVKEKEFKIKHHLYQLLQ